MFISLYHIHLLTINSIYILKLTNWKATFYYFQVNGGNKIQRNVEEFATLLWRQIKDRNFHRWADLIQTFPIKITEILTVEDWALGGERDN